MEVLPKFFCSGIAALLLEKKMTAGSSDHPF
jgi:hypothetical protein